MRNFLLVCLMVLVGTVWSTSADMQKNHDPTVQANNAGLSPEQVLNFFDSFEAYTAGTQLTVQTNNWTTWSGTPGGGEDPLVSNSFAYSGSNSVVIVQNNDLVKTFGQLTSGKWQITFKIYIPSGQAGYFNTLAGFTPNPFSWGMEVYFNVGGNGEIYGGSSTPVTFSYAYDTWQMVEVIVDLDNDMAEFYFEGNLIHSWQWTLGAGGGGGPLQLDASDFFGATADDQMYIDDYSIEEITPLVLFSDNFDGYTAGTQLALQNPVFWTTWSDAPGTGEDPFVSNSFAYSDSNSVVIVQNNDLVKTFGQLTSGKWNISFQIYIPNGKAGYFNTLAGFTPNPFSWGMEVYFNVGGNGEVYGGSSTPVAFTYAYDTWQMVEVIVDLDNDMAEFYFDGSLVHSWQWTLGAGGGGGPLQLDASDFFGATADDELYIDDYSIVEDTTVVGISNSELQIPAEFALSQNYPNPFNPSTTIQYQLPKATHVRIDIYNLMGQKVRTLVNDFKEPGSFQVQWNGLNESGDQAASGIYIYRIQAGDFVKAKRMVLLK